MKFFHPQRGTNSERKNKGQLIFKYLLLYLLWLNTLKGTEKVPIVDLLRLKSLRGTKTAFLTPKRYDKHTGPFYMGLLQCQ